MPNIERRMEALAEKIRRRLQFDREGPIDPLSKCLYEMEDELLSLDEAGKALLLAEMNRDDWTDGTTPLNMTMDGLERMIADCRERRKFVW